MDNLSSTYYQSPLGFLKISGTPDFISEVSFRDQAPAQEEINHDPAPLLVECLEQLMQYFDGQRLIFELPLNQHGTNFQQQTWNLLTGIPFGKTISYLQLAISTGDPKATRAVANANGRNNIAIIVPCHRVIGSNRELTGYAGGLWRKRWLLEHETKVMYGVQTLF
ncbi:methylated-DNA--[protein]-cysteine S-methyltransferase [Terrimonas sp. NA20]|uniref:Methylated-DNA--protein-cysteine methyltransferase n=1 Tax=Terrimonas ginsenosidimutans TaxID=2908004 RepID=A0ABS9KYL3_9BACT|nr:methylated-DNA--[protein]-cysteine S-methyltransferase [Terrimonas ginsenosidimutans]MCG2617482.1 methylated-DNA--[protein]-cysteine S-methyltransferase [Terrimonas ginsenosidimutans]